MAQKNYTVTLTNGSPTFTISGDVTADLGTGDVVVRVSEGVPYYIASPPSYSAPDTTVTLSANYAGTTGSAAIRINTDFEDLDGESIPLLYSGDLETPAIYTRAMTVIASVINGLITGLRDFTNIVITGGTITGITDLAVADGGTGASTAAGARTNLGLGTVATYNTGTSGTTIPVLDGTNTWSAQQTLSAGIVVPQSTGSAVVGIAGDGATLTIANTATVTPFGNANNFSGLILIAGLTSGNTALFLTAGGIMILVAQTGTDFSATAANPSTTNVYLNSFVVTVQNNTGASVDYLITPIRNRNFN